MPTTDRRPISTRSARWAQHSAHWLAQKNITPNTISVFSMVFALLSALAFAFAFYFSSALMTRLFLVLAALGIQGRLLCNLFDGMVAIEGKQHSPIGAIYNDLPDRISDSLLFLGVGYGLLLFSTAATLAWAVSVVALLTAYVRLLGGSCGLPQRFTGPLAKQQRMAILTLAALIAAFLPIEKAQLVLFITLWILLFGSLFTVFLRLRLVARDLNNTKEDT